MTKKAKLIIPVLFFLFLLVIIIKCAWVCDDSFISFRYVKNLVNGYGLRWNVQERVQAFTNPLYTFCVIPIFLLTKNVYLSSIILSIGLTMTAVIIAFYSNKKSTVLLGIFIIIISCSKAFIDYSTSGLENPMTFLLLILFYKRFFTIEKFYDPKEFLKLCFIASFLALNRIDSLLFVIPPLIYSFFKKFNLKKIGIGFIGFVPIIIWEVFSFIYYGFLVPNTAIAKLNNTTDLINNLRNGLRYIATSHLYGDYITLTIILVSIILGVLLYKYKRKYSLASFGVLTYVCYVIYIGGDFMMGRFLAAPFLLAAYIVFNVIYDYSLNNQWFRKKTKSFVVALAIVILIMGSISPTSPITSKLKYDNNYSPIIIDTSIRPMDERWFYYNDAGLAYYVANSVLLGYNPNRPIYDWGRMGKFYTDGSVNSCVTIGFKGYFADDEAIIVDVLALADPLLARIPAAPNQRVGHYERPVPEGYLETIETGQNVIKDPSLREYYEYLRKITSSNIFDLDRLKTIIDMNCGKYKYLMNKYTKSDEYKQYLLRIEERNRLKAQQD